MPYATGAEPPKVVVLAGANGAGKTTAAPTLLRGELGLSSFVNADVIAEGLSGFDAESVAAEAGRIMLARMDSLETARESFAFESTLSGRAHLARLGRMAADGYEVEIFLLWLPSPELAIARVETRSRHGGHHVPPEVVRRRYARGLVNFVRLYRPLASAWRVYDGSGRRSELDSVPLIARGEHQRVLEVKDESKWATIARQLSLAEIREAPPMHYQPAKHGSERTPTGDDLDRAMTRGFYRAVRLHRAFDVPLVMWIDDEVRYVDPWSVPLPTDSDVKYESGSAEPVASPPRAAPEKL